MKPRRPRPTRQAAPKHTGEKIHIRGRDDAPLSLSEFQQGLYELAQRLDRYSDYRIKRATLYLTMVDQNGETVTISPTGEASLFPYRAAADDMKP